MNIDGADDYSFSPLAASYLMAVATQPAAERKKLLAKYFTERDDALDVLSQFIGLANSVALNCKEHGVDLLVEFGTHPNTAEKINMPTIIGALNGVRVAEGIDVSKVCASCAFRLGSTANQCPGTTVDALDCSQPGEQPFWCHIEFDDKGDPTTACAGFAQRRAMLKRGSPADA